MPKPKSQREPLPLAVALRTYHLIGCNDHWWNLYRKACREVGWPDPGHPTLRAV